MAQRSSAIILDEFFVEVVIMCSRYSLTAPPEEVQAYFGTINAAEFPPRYNIAPTQPVSIVRLDARGRRELCLVRWGLIPPWVKDPRDFATLINARSETADEKPSFRGAMRHRRCLVPFTGFYEWVGQRGSKQPYLIAPREGNIMGFAGLWEHWLGADGSEVETMAILTTRANGDMEAIHERMPVILLPEYFDAWLDCRSGSSADVQEFLEPLADGQLTVVAVSRKVNNPRNDSQEVQEPAEPPLI